MLQLNVNALSQIEKLSAENDRLKESKNELEKNIEIEINLAVSRIKENCNKRIKSFERELEKSNAALLKERQKHREDIRKLQDLINKNNL
jgi:cell division protein FtsB